MLPHDGQSPGRRRCRCYIAFLACCFHAAWAEKADTKVTAADFIKLSSSIQGLFDTPNAVAPLNLTGTSASDPQNSSASANLTTAETIQGLFGVPATTELVSNATIPDNASYAPKLTASAANASGPADVSAPVPNTTANATVKAAVNATVNATSTDDIPEKDVEELPMADVVLDEDPPSNATVAVNVITVANATSQVNETTPARRPIIDIHVAEAKPNASVGTNSAKPPSNSTALAVAPDSNLTTSPAQILANITNSTQAFIGASATVNPASNVTMQNTLRVPNLTAPPAQISTDTGGAAGIEAAVSNVAVSKPALQSNASVAVNRTAAGNTALTVNSAHEVGTTAISNASAASSNSAGRNVSTAQNLTTPPGQMSAGLANSIQGLFGEQPSNATRHYDSQVLNRTSAPPDVTAGISAAFSTSTDVSERANENGVSTPPVEPAAIENENPEGQDFWNGEAGVAKNVSRAPVASPAGAEPATLATPSAPAAPAQPSIVFSAPPVVKPSIAQSIGTKTARTTNMEPATLAGPVAPAATVITINVEPAAPTATVATSKVDAPAVRADRPTPAVPVPSVIPVATAISSVTAKLAPVDASAAPAVPAASPHEHALEEEVAMLRARLDSVESKLSKEAQTKQTTRGRDVPATIGGPALVSARVAPLRPALLGVQSHGEPAAGVVHHERQTRVAAAAVPSFNSRRSPSILPSARLASDAAGSSGALASPRTTSDHAAEAGPKQSIHTHTAHDEVVASQPYGAMDEKIRRKISLPTEPQDSAELNTKSDVTLATDHSAGDRRPSQTPALPDDPTLTDMDEQADATNEKDAGDQASPSPQADGTCGFMGRLLQRLSVGFWHGCDQQETAVSTATVHFNSKANQSRLTSSGSLYLASTAKAARKDGFQTIAIEDPWAQLEQDDAAQVEQVRREDTVLRLAAAVVAPPRRPTKEEIVSQRATHIGNFWKALEREDGYIGATIDTGDFDDYGRLQRRQDARMGSAGEALESAARRQWQLRHGVRRP